MRPVEGLCEMFESMRSLRDLKMDGSETDKDSKRVELLRPLSLVKSHDISQVSTEFIESL